MEPLHRCSQKLESDDRMNAVPTHLNMNTQKLRNLAHRPAKPAKGNGRVQRACKRVLWALGEASTSEVLQWTCAMKLHRDQHIEQWDSRSTRRALKSIGAQRLDRASTIGRPWRWRLRDDG